MVISRDRYFLDRLVDRVVELEGGVLRGAPIACCALVP